MRLTNYMIGRTSVSSNLIANQADELMIANMIGVLNNPLVTKLMEEDELAILCQVVKNHVVERANFIVEQQNNSRQAFEALGKLR